MVKRSKSIYNKINNDNGNECILCRKSSTEPYLGQLFNQEIVVHENCLFFSPLLHQELDPGNHKPNYIVGFSIDKIKQEAKRISRLKCVACHKNSAGVGCCLSTCRKSFHLACGIRKNCIGIFNGGFEFYCKQHGPLQELKSEINNVNNNEMPECTLCLSSIVEPGYDDDNSDNKTYNLTERINNHYVIHGKCCPKCWMHRSCMQRYGISAGLHHAKCPQCSNTTIFRETVQSFGIWLPDRDASWELEPGAFRDMYEENGDNNEIESISSSITNHTNPIAIITPVKSIIHDVDSEQMQLRTSVRRSRSQLSKLKVNNKNNESKLSRSVKLGRTKSQNFVLNTMKVVNSVCEDITSLKYNSGSCVTSGDSKEISSRSTCVEFMSVVNDVAPIKKDSNSISSDNITNESSQMKVNKAVGMDMGPPIDSKSNDNAIVNNNDTKSSQIESIFDNRPMKLRNSVRKCRSIQLEKSEGDKAILGLKNTKIIDEKSVTNVISTPNNDKTVKCISNKHKSSKIDRNKGCNSSKFKKNTIEKVLDKIVPNKDPENNVILCSTEDTYKNISTETDTTDMWKITSSNVVSDPAITANNDKGLTTVFHKIIEENKKTIKSNAAVSNNKINKPNNNNEKSANKSAKSPNNNTKKLTSPEFNKKLSSYDIRNYISISPTSPSNTSFNIHNSHKSRKRKLSANISPSQIISNKCKMRKVNMLSPHTSKLSFNECRSCSRRFLAINKKSKHRILQDLHNKHNSSSNFSKPSSFLCCECSQISESPILQSTSTT